MVRNSTFSLLVRDYFPGVRDVGHLRLETLSLVSGYLNLSTWRVTVGRRFCGRQVTS